MQCQKKRLSFIGACPAVQHSGSLAAALYGASRLAEGVAAQRQRAPTLPPRTSRPRALPCLRYISAMALSRASTSLQLGRCAGSAAQQSLHAAEGGFER